ncbi:MAG: LPS export ABC transporter ATP-binding protein [Schwartzia sp.]|nr:LPS export ABC transporter ATP-binding protein [Schwartzia sp. (in: firmicutes)]
MRIEAKNLVKTYNNRNVVNGVSFDVSTGEIVGLLGPNGAGKTTTFYMVIGLERPSAGDVFVTDNGSETNVAGMPMCDRANLGISYLAQESSIFRKLTVEENLMSILETTTLSPEEQKRKMEELLEEFNVIHRRNAKGSELSGGERRRVEIARCLALEPKIIMLDEPFAGVDPIAVADIQSMIRYLRERGMGILITDHNVRETLKITDRAYILNDGEILVEGTAGEIVENSLAKKYYLGEDFSL